MTWLELSWIVSETYMSLVGVTQPCLRINLNHANQQAAGPTLPLISNMTSQNNSKQLIAFGFGTVIVLVILLAIVTMDRVNSVKTSFARVVEINNAKIELAMTMREAIRLRKISMHKMLITEDVFERDDELLKFYNYAGSYRIAREKLATFEPNKEESNINSRLNEQTRISQPVKRNVTELISDNMPINKIRPMLAKAAANQSKVLELLNELVAHHKARSSNAVANAQQEYKAMLTFTITLGSIIILIIVGIGVFVARYVTKQNAALLNATEAKSSFLAVMSHEIRTPLTSIIGFGESLQENNFSTTNENKAVNSIVRNGKHLLQIINDVLDLSKIEAGKIEPEQIDTPLFELIKDISEITEPEAKEKGLAFKINYNFPLPANIITDPVRLKQILINVCSNAIKFTASGYISIDISYRHENKMIDFLVADTGIGLSKDQQDKIFDSFTQADSSTTRRFGGTGLGLHLSKQFAEILGGNIAVESQRHKGSQFTISVAAGNISSDNLVNALPDQETIKPIKKQIRKVLNGCILLAEDNIDNQRLFDMYISRTGARLVIVNNGAEAVDKANNQHFDLILMDKLMPVMGGIEAVKELRDTGYKKPVVALTANATQQDREECLSAGCDDFLTKPVDMVKFMAILEKYLPASTESNTGQPGSTPYVQVS